MKKTLFVFTALCCIASACLAQGKKATAPFDYDKACGFIKAKGTHVADIGLDHPKSGGQSCKINGATLAIPTSGDFIYLKKGGRHSLVYKDGTVEMASTDPNAKPDKTKMAAVKNDIATLIQQ